MEIGRIALMASDFEGGGVERNLSSLALGLAGLGVEVEFLAGDPGHPYLRGLSPAVRIVPVPASGARTAALRDYLSQARPDLLVTGKLKDDFAALEARAALAPDAGGATRLVAAVGTPLSARFAAHRWNPLKTGRETRRIRDAYRQLDGLTAVSREVADDLVRVFGLGALPLAVLANPIVPEDLDALAAAPCTHPWLNERGPDGRAPVAVALGGLRQVKDFPTLLRAFARLERPGLKLLILGEGKERGRLVRLARRLGIAERLDLHGFVPNPFPYLARAQVLALSSRREGLPNALVESMALGTPVVATDCTSGVRGLLQDGRLGDLVPVGDAVALAAALERTLAASAAGTLDRDALRRAALPYRLVPAAQGYLDFFRTLPERAG
jgi:glycosyltransferase involved in cell wall biosynthesis